MKENMRLFIRRVGHTFYSIHAIAAVITLIVLSPSMLHGQSQTQVPRDPREPTIEQRQSALRGLDTRNPRLSTLSLYEKIREDLDSLEMLRYRLSEAVDSSTTPDYKRIREDAAEVKKRAARLKSELYLPKPRDDEKLKNSEAELPPEDLKPAIDELSDLIENFVSNHTFQRASVLSRNRESDRHDLERMRSLSEQIRKCAEALGKAAVKK